MKFPKPQYCGQKWSDMTPTEGGRICGKCTKKIIDFSGESWTRIHEIQRAHNYTACGKYSASQLKNWQETAPISRKPYRRWVAAATFVAVLAPTYPVSIFEQAPITHQQTPSQKDKKENVVTSHTPTLVVSGKIRFEDGSFAGEEAMGVTISIPELGIGTFSNDEGDFRLEIIQEWSTIEHYSLQFSYLGYETQEIPVSSLRRPNCILNIELVEAGNRLSVFYVEGEKPPFFQWIKGRIRRIFTRKKKRE